MKFRFVDINSLCCNLCIKFVVHTCMKYAEHNYKKDFYMSVTYHVTSIRAHALDVEEYSNQRNVAIRVIS